MRRIFVPILAILAGCTIQVPELSELCAQLGLVCTPSDSGVITVIVGDASPPPAPDAGPSIDAAVPDAGQPVVDAGAPVQDAAQPPVQDAGQPVQDASTPPAPDAGAANVLSVRGRYVVDTLGTDFVLRGPEVVVSSIDQLADIDTIAATGANGLRMLLTLDVANQMTPATFDQLVGRAVQHRLVVWVSLFTWDDSCGRCIAPALGGGQLQTMSDYLLIWQRTWLKQLVAKYSRWIVIDAVQEFRASTEPPEGAAATSEWVATAKQHIAFFRAQGYNQPLEIMTAFEGRNLAAIVDHADEIRATDTVSRYGQPQVMFGFQAYLPSGWWREYQGYELLGPGQTITPWQAITQFVATRNYPIQVGIDEVAPGDTEPGEGYGIIMQTASASNVSWLFWAWNDIVGNSWGSTVRNSTAGFAGATKTLQ